MSCLKKNPDCNFESALFICRQVFVFNKLLAVGAVAQYSWRYSIQVNLFCTSMTRG